MDPQVDRVIEMETPSEASSSTAKQKPRHPSSLACVPCRHRHLKCDALMPVCSRCQATGTECFYVRSKRGLRPKKSVISQGFSPGLASSSDTDMISDMPGDPAMFTGIGMDELSQEWLLPGVSLQTEEMEQGLFPTLEGAPSLSLAETTGIPTNELVPLGYGPAQAAGSYHDVAFDPMIQLFYQNFFASHPFVVPRRALSGPLCRHIPGYLLNIMRYVGAHFHPDPIFKEMYRKPAYAGFASDASRTGFKVQAMLLLAIVEHAHANEERAFQTLQGAIKMALELGMNQAPFAPENCFGDAVLEESWRRTYWELYVVSGLFAAIGGHAAAFSLHCQPVDLRLPCDEAVYAAANAIPQEKTLDQLQNKWLYGGADYTFSSFAHRIEAIRILGMVLAQNSSLDHNDDLQAETIDARLASLAMHLPLPQREMYGGCGELDEMKFQGQMITYLALIYLHHPRSNMRFASFQSRTSCTRLRASEGNYSIADLDLHSVKLVRAADQLSNLAALPSPIKRHTPFMTCALAMSVMVHTAATLLVAGSDREESVKVRIQLGIGGLNMLSEVWPLARTVKKQVLDVYNEVAVV